MAEDRKKRVNWLAVRTAYVVNGMSANECSKEFGVHVVTIKRRASSEGWTAERTRNTTQGAQAVSERMVEAVEARLLKDADTVEGVLRIGAKLGALIEESIDLMCQSKNFAFLRSTTETFARFSEAQVKTLQTKRLILGIPNGAASDGVDASEMDDVLTIVSERVENAKRTVQESA